MVKVIMTEYEIKEYFECILKQYDSCDTPFQFGCEQAIRDILALNELYSSKFIEKLPNVIFMRQDEFKYYDNIYSDEWIKGYMNIINKIEE